jgi:cell division protein FtsB
VDQPVKPSKRNVEDRAVQVRAASDPPLPFFAHLADFFRRNVLSFLIVGLALLIVQDIFGTHGVLAMHRSQVEANRIRQEIQRLDQENQKLQDNVKDLKSDPATIEGCARSMGYARKGEVIFKLPQTSADSTCPATSPNTPATSR